MGKRHTTTQDYLRLDAIAEHLKIKCRYPQKHFTQAVIDACLERVAPIVNEVLPCSGEQIAAALGSHLNLTFEEVRNRSDVNDLLQRYLREKKEIGFAQLPDELARPGVDALLFERMNAGELDPDRWVAVLNLQDSDVKGYWNRFHELSHRIAEPPQAMLPFRRHQFEASNPVEALMDAIAAELAFYEPAFRPLVERCAQRDRLTFDVVDLLRSQFASSASLLSTLKAIVKYWPQPAALLICEFRGRVSAPRNDMALRVTPQGYNKAASNIGLKFIFNMRVPQGSPIDLAFRSGLDQNEFERLGDWTTSDGTCLPSLNVYTSAKRLGTRVYSLLSVSDATRPENYRQKLAASRLR